MAFGSLFDDIYVTKTDASKKEVQRIKVPITYGPKEKWLVRLEQDPDILKEKAVILPRMAFEMSTIVPDPTRQFNKTYRQAYQYNSTNRLYQYNPVPWNIHFSLYVMTKYVEDGFQIVEQIFPFFSQAWTVTVNVIPEMNLRDDIPIIMESVTQEDSFDGSFEQRRLVMWTLNFVAKANFYGPITNQSIIRKAITDFHIPSGADPVTEEEIQNTPRVVRGESVIDPIDAEPTDDYTVIDTVTEFDDGKKYDPVLGIDVPIGGNTVILSTARVNTVRQKVSSIT